LGGNRDKNCVLRRSITKKLLQLLIREEEEEEEDKLQGRR
jgi:hypothetical protein